MSWMRPRQCSLTPWAVTSTCCPGAISNGLLPAMAEPACKRLCSLLRAVPLRCCRVDLVIRRAFIAAGAHGLGNHRLSDRLRRSPQPRPL